MVSTPYLAEANVLNPARVPNPFGLGVREMGTGAARTLLAGTCLLAAARRSLPLLYGSHWDTSTWSAAQITNFLRDQPIAEAEPRPARRIDVPSGRASGWWLGLRDKGRARLRIARARSGVRLADRVAGVGHPPPAPTDRSVRISRTTLFERWFTAQR